MAKTCSVCSTESGDEARFCRRCGTPFAATPDTAPAARAPVRATVPPPGAEPATRAPARVTRPMPLHEVIEPTRPPQRRVQKRAARNYPYAPGATDSAEPRASSAPLAIALTVAALIVGGGAWWLLAGTALPRNVTAPVPAAARSVPPAAPVDDAAVPAPVEGAASPAAIAPASVPMPAGTSPSAASLPQAAVEPALPSHATPPIATSAAPHSDGDAAHRAALEKKAQDRVHDKAERDAKAKALVARRDHARRLAEQDAARRRAEAQRAGAIEPTAPSPPAVSSMPAVPAAAPAQPRGVAERCAGGNAIRRGICEARECIGSAHAADPVCKRLREIDDRRRQ